MPMLHGILSVADHILHKQLQPMFPCDPCQLPIYGYIVLYVLIRGSAAPQMEHQLGSLQFPRHVAVDPKQPQSRFQILVPSAADGLSHILIAMHHRYLQTYFPKIGQNLLSLLVPCIIHHELKAVAVQLSGQRLQQPIVSLVGSADQCPRGAQNLIHLPFSLLWYSFSFSQ